MAEKSTKMAAKATTTEKQAKPLFTRENIEAQVKRIQNLPYEEMIKEAELIQADLKEYALNHFSFDRYQMRVIENACPGHFAERGKILAQAFIDRNEIVVSQSKKIKCPKVTVSITFEW